MSSSSLSARLRFRGRPGLLPLGRGCDEAGLGAAGGLDSVPGILRGLPRLRLTGTSGALLSAPSCLTRGGMGTPVSTFAGSGAAEYGLGIEYGWLDPPMPLSGMLEGGGPGR